MRIVILDGRQEPCTMDAWLDALERGLAGRGVEVVRFALRRMSLQQCRGCFRCWVRTPGRCDIRDDGEQLLRAVAAADVVAIASPVVMGLPTALSRRALERFLPLLHPYFEIVEGEVHHRARYARRPRVALLHGAEGCDAEDAEILALLHRRAALNFRSELSLVASTKRDPEEVSLALARV
jgi:multimeric flavodoxin WrbA